MTIVTFHRDKTGEIRGFDCIGHSDFAAKGEDIVCASISALVINTINSVEEIAHDQMQVISNEEDGLISCKFPDKPNRDSEVLLKSLELGLTQIAKQYKKNCKIKNKEV